MGCTYDTHTHDAHIGHAPAQGRTHGHTQGYTYIMHTHGHTPTHTAHVGTHTQVAHTYNTHTCCHTRDTHTHSTHMDDTYVARAGCTYMGHTQD